MKKIAISIICPFIGALLMTSCLKDDVDVVQSSEVALLSFAINDVKTVHTVEGTDSTYTTIMSGSTVIFTIDQANHLVYNTDSIAYGTDVTHVQVKVAADGYVHYLKPDGEIGSIEDSIDFSSPVTFRVVSYDKQFQRDYRVSLNVHQVNPKKTSWTQIAGSKFPAGLFVTHKALVKGDSLYVIGKDADGKVYKASTAITDGREWSVAECIGLAGDADCGSVQLAGNTFCMTAGGMLFRSSDATTWESVEIASSMHLLFAVEGIENYVVWGICDEDFMLTTDMVTWSGTSGQYFEKGISRGVASFCQPLRTNKHIERTVFVAIPQAPDTCAQVWTKLSTESDWVKMDPKEDNIYGCPNLENLAVIAYAGKMYAFGGQSVGNRRVPLEAFSQSYESRDNGVTWKPNKNAFSLPEAFKGRTEIFSAATDGEYVWVIWSNGEVWRGRWNGMK